MSLPPKTTLAVFVNLFLKSLLLIDEGGKLRHSRMNTFGGVVVVAGDANSIIIEVVKFGSFVFLTGFRQAFKNL